MPPCLSRTITIIDEAAAVGLNLWRLLLHGPGITLHSSCALLAQLACIHLELLVLQNINLHNRLTRAIFPALPKKQLVDPNTAVAMRDKRWKIEIERILSACWQVPSYESLGDCVRTNRLTDLEFSYVPAF